MKDYLKLVIEKMTKWHNMDEQTLGRFHSYPASKKTAEFIQDMQVCENMLKGMRESIC